MVMESNSRETFKKVFGDLDDVKAALFGGRDEEDYGGEGDDDDEED